MVSISEASKLPDQEEERHKTLRLFVSVALISCPIFIAAYWYLGSPGAALAIAGGFPFIALTLLVSKWTRSIDVATHWLASTGFFIFFTSACFTGGFEAPALTWSIAIPIVAILLSGIRSGIFWMLMVSIKMLFFHFAEHMGIHFTQQYSPESFDDAYGLTLLGISVFLFLLGVSSNYYKNLYMKKLHASHAELADALIKIQTLRTLLPICAWCKRVRNDKGYWDQIETYFSQHARIDVSHGICPECSSKAQEDKSFQGPVS